MEQKYDELYHYGILGMKWGIRRYQNEDGSLTEAGKKRYGVGLETLGKRIDRAAVKNPNNAAAAHLTALREITYDRSSPIATKGIKRFNKDTPEYKQLVKASKEHSDAENKINKEVYKKLRSEGYNTKKLHESNIGTKEWQEIYDAGLKFASDIGEKYNYTEKTNKWLTASEAYEAKVRKYLNSYEVSKFLNKPVSSVNSIVVDLRDGTKRNATVKEVLAMEMLRKAGGHI